MGQRMHTPPGTPVSTLAMIPCSISIVPLVIDPATQYHYSITALEITSGLSFREQQSLHCLYGIEHHQSHVYVQSLVGRPVTS